MTVRPLEQRGGVPAPAPVILDGATLTPGAVASIARDGAEARLAPEAHARNDRAREAIAALLARGDDLYGVTTGVGALRAYRVPKNSRERYSLNLLRSHACGAGQPLQVQLVRAAMATRANQIGAGGAGVAGELLDAVVAALNAGLSPFTRELGSLGTGDLTNLADIALALLGEGRVWRGDELVDAEVGLVDAGLTPARLGPRDGLAFMSSNAVSIGHAALLVVDARRLLDAWLSVAALSFEAAAADPVVLDPRIHSWRHRPGQAAVAARMRELLAGLEDRARAPGPLGIQDPYPFRAQPQVDGTVHDALLVLEETVGHELNFAGENALIVARRGGPAQRQPARGAPLANAIDGLRTALAQSAALIAARVSTLLDASLTGLPPFLARSSGTGVRSAGPRVHRARRRGRGALAGHAGGRADGGGVPGRGVTLQPGADRRPPRAGDAPCPARGGRDRAGGGCAGAAARRAGARRRRHSRSVGGRRRAPGSGPERPAAAPGRRVGPADGRGLGSSLAEAASETGQARRIAY